MRKKFFLLILALFISRDSSAGWFGPSNYDECILEKMKGVSSDVAADEVKEACKRQYPGTAPKANPAKASSAKPEVLRRELKKTSDGKSEVPEVTPASASTPSTKDSNSAKSAVKSTSSETKKRATGKKTRNNQSKIAKTEEKWKTYGDELYQKGKYEIAAAAYASALKIPTLNDQTKAELYSKRALAYKNLKKYPQAFKDANKAIAFNPREAHYYSLRASIHYSLGSYRKAIADYDAAIKLNPQESGYYDSRALAKKANGNLRQSLEDVNAAIAINPKDHLAYKLRGNLYYEARNYNQACKDYTSSIELASSQPGLYRAELFLNRGFSYLDAGRHDDGLKDMRSAARLGNLKAQNYLRSSGLQW
ncbi:MAG: tetratricopeptide repeat protein [Nitrospirae bacterium]|nr:tetratricopeptide repeat protein [Nitrospirota bacterium]